MLAPSWTGMLAAWRDDIPAQELCSYTRAKHSDSMCHVDQICQKPGATLVNARVLHLAPGNHHTHLPVLVTRANPPSLSTKQLLHQPVPALAVCCPQLMGSSTTSHCCWLCRSWGWLKQVILGRFCIHMGCQLLGTNIQRQVFGDWRKGK